VKIRKNTLSNEYLLRTMKALKVSSLVNISTKLFANLKKISKKKYTTVIREIKTLKTPIGITNNPKSP